MHIPSVLNVLGRLIMLFGVTMLAPLVVALTDRDEPRAAGEPLAFGVAIGCCLLLGFALRFRNRLDLDRFRHREGFAVVALGWLLCGLLGAVPFMLARESLALTFTDAVFETISGLTTTGASVLTDVEAYGRGLLFWRALTHWLGGMGIIVLTVAILPGLGAGAYSMLRFEAPGPTADRIAPRIAQTAKILWGVYCLFTLIQFLLLWAPSWFGVPEHGMNWHDAICHAFATLATGGFSTRAMSVAAFSPYVQWVIIVFMYLAGVSFVLHFNVLRGRPRVMLTNHEWRLYTTFVLVAALIMFAGLSLMNTDATPEAGAGGGLVANAPERLGATLGESYEGAGERFRHSMFQTLAILTTTGFATADFDAWPNVLRITLVALMFIGGCAGSTGGGLKQIRMLVLVKYAWRELRRIAQPHRIMHLKIGDTRVDRQAISGILATFILFALLTGLGATLLSLDPGADLVTAFSATAATIGNIGPGLGAVGATQHYAWMTDFSKWVATALMVLGRLEVFAVLLLLVPATWRR